MWTNIINIGNSKGIILPASVLRELKIKEKSAVDISVKDGKIIIETSPRQGWELSAKECAERGDDQLLMPDVFSEEAFEDW